MGVGFTIKELAERTGLTQHTLRYYENAGLLLDITRRTNGRRVYSQGDLERAILLTKLRSSGMTVAEVRRFVELSTDENLDRATRREVLADYQEQIKERIRQLEDALAAVTDLYEAAAPSTQPDAEPDSLPDAQLWRANGGGSAAQAT